MVDSNVQGTLRPGVRSGPKGCGLPVEARGSVALVTNAHSELGRAFVDGLLERGASRIYAVANAAGGVADDRVRPLRLDMTSPADVARAVRLCRDVNLLVVHQSSQRSMFGLARRELDSTVYNLMRLARAFAPRLARNGGGGLVNVLPPVAHGSHGAGVRGSAFGAAAVAVTEALRMELRAQGTAVLGVHPGDVGLPGAVFGSEGPSGAARRLVRLVLEALCAGQPQVFANSPNEEGWTFIRDSSPAHAVMW